MGLNDLQFGQQLNEILRRRFGVQEQPAPVMATEFFPNVILEAERPEWLYYATERRSSGHAFDAAVAGQFSHVGLQLGPGDTEIMLTVERILISDAVGNRSFVIGWSNNAALIDVAFNGTPMDSRWNDPNPTTGRGAIVLLTQVATGVAATEEMALFQTPGIGTFEVPISPVVIGSPNILYIRGNLANEPVGASFVWRERRLGPYERAQS